MTEHEHQFNRAVAESDSAAERDEAATERKKYERKPTVRFTVEEALPIQEALNYYFGGLKETVGSPSLHKIQDRLARFIEKFATKEPS